MTPELYWEHCVRNSFDPYCPINTQNLTGSLAGLLWAKKWNESISIQLSAFFEWERPPSVEVLRWQIAERHSLWPANSKALSPSSACALHFQKWSCLRGCCVSALLTDSNPKSHWELEIHQQVVGDSVTANWVSFRPRLLPQQSYLRVQWNTRLPASCSFWGL